MKRKQIVERIAVQREVPLHTAADWLDSFLHKLMQQLKGSHLILKDKELAAKEQPVDTP